MPMPRLRMCAAAWRRSWLTRAPMPPQSFARDILSVADNLGRALDSIPAELREDDKFKGLVVGLEATGREVESVFSRHGIEKVAGVGRDARSQPASGDGRAAER
jgi:hypothetical protein